MASGAQDGDVGASFAAECAVVPMMCVQVTSVHGISLALFAAPACLGLPAACFALPFGALNVRAVFAAEPSASGAAHDAPADGGEGDGRDCRFAAHIIVRIRSQPYTMIMPTATYTRCGAFAATAQTMRAGTHRRRTTAQAIWIITARFHSSIMMTRQYKPCGGHDAVCTSSRSAGAVVRSGSSRTPGSTRISSHRPCRSRCKHSPLCPSRP